MADKETKHREERALAAAIAELNIPGQIVTLDSYLRDALENLEFGQNRMKTPSRGSV